MTDELNYEKAREILWAVLKRVGWTRNQFAREAEIPQPDLTTFMGDPDRGRAPTRPTSFGLTNAVKADAVFDRLGVDVATRREFLKAVGATAVLHLLPAELHGELLQSWQSEDADNPALKQLREDRVLVTELARFAASCRGLVVVQRVSRDEISKYSEQGWIGEEERIRMLAKWNLVFGMSLREASMAPPLASLASFLRTQNLAAEIEDWELFSLAAWLEIEHYRKRAEVVRRGTDHVALQQQIWTLSEELIVRTPSPEGRKMAFMERAKLAMIYDQDSVFLDAIEAGESEADDPSPLLPQEDSMADPWLQFWVPYQQANFLDAKGRGISLWGSHSGERTTEIRALAREARALENGISAVLDEATLRYSESEALFRDNQGDYLGEALRLWQDGYRTAKKEGWQMQIHGGEKLAARIQRWLGRNSSLDAFEALCDECLTISIHFYDRLYERFTCSKCHSPTIIFP